MMLSLVQVCPCHPLFQINYIATLKYWILDINGFYVLLKAHLSLLINVKFGEANDNNFPPCPFFKTSLYFFAF